MQSTPASQITDKHYNFLLDMLIEERQSRRNLEVFITKLQSDVSHLQLCGCTGTSITSPVNNTAALETKFKTLNSKFEKLENEYSVVVNRSIQLENELFDLKNLKLNSLQKDLETLKVQSTQLKSDYSLVVNKSDQLESELQEVKQLKSVSDLQIVLNLQKQANDLSQEIGQTNNRQRAIISDNNARKQDFLALLQKVITSERQMQTMNNKTVSIGAGLQTIEASLLAMNRSIQHQYNGMANKAVPAFAASLTHSATYSSGEIMKFDKVWTNIGSGYDPNTGVFTAPEAGVYQFACTIMRYTEDVGAFLFRNEMKTVAIWPSNYNNLDMGTLNVVLQLQKADRVPIGDEERLDSIPSLVGREYHLTNFVSNDHAIADIQLSSLGWVSVTKSENSDVRLRAYTPGARGLYLREPALLPNIKAFRGKRIGGKQEYRIQPPKML
ncbi:NOA1 [Mytilus edulis]|uniref:NOA1 n=1 Tax=Mytilus edulis TaxID=6550 RepID=A0A8S3VAM5_MYTED|nr:NOA1 [Mytilus edulis]